MDHGQSIEELTQEIDRLKALLQTKENELSTRIANNRRELSANKKNARLHMRSNYKAKISSQVGRLFSAPQGLLGTIKSNFSTTYKKVEEAFRNYAAIKEGANFQMSAQAIYQNYSYDASIDEIIKNFSDALKVQQERLEELALKNSKKQKISKVNARVTLSPKLLMNKIEKNFNKAKIAVMHRVSDVSYKYGEYKETKAYERDQKLSEELQAIEEKERMRMRKADFKAAIKEQKREDKLQFKENFKAKVNHAKSSVVTMPFVLMNSIKKNFNKAKISALSKVNSLSAKYSEYKETKASVRDQKLADELQAIEEKERTKMRKADFKAALKEQTKIERKERNEVRKHKVSSAFSYVITIPKNQIAKVKAGISHISGSIQSKYGELYQEVMDSKEERQHIKNQKIAEELQAQQEKEQAKPRKADFKAAIKSEKREDRERRHQAILDMIKALDQEQQEVIQAQKEEISSLHSQIMYNMGETGGRRR